MLKATRLSLIASVLMCASCGALSIDKPRLQDAPAPIEFKLITIPIDSGLLDCGGKAKDWQPSDIDTVNDLMRLLSKSRAGLQDCWNKQDAIAHPVEMGTNQPP